jgi:hypothetical protein
MKPINWVPVVNATYWQFTIDDFLYNQTSLNLCPDINCMAIFGIRHSSTLFFILFIYFNFILLYLLFYFNQFLLQATINPFHYTSKDNAAVISTYFPNHKFFFFLFFILHCVYSAPKGGIWTACYSSLANYTFVINKSNYSFSRNQYAWLYLNDNTTNCVVAFQPTNLLLPQVSWMMYVQ